MNNTITSARVDLRSDTVTRPTAGMREAAAEASSQYLEAVQAERDAVEHDEYHRAARAKAEAIIEAWRTESATIRAAERIR